jgi:hypothetical protein
MAWCCPSTLLSHVLLFCAVGGTFPPLRAAGVFGWSHCRRTFQRASSAAHPPTGRYRRIHQILTGLLAGSAVPKRTNTLPLSCLSAAWANGPSLLAETLGHAKPCCTSYRMHDQTLISFRPIARRIRGPPHTHTDLRDTTHPSPGHSLHGPTPSPRLPLVQQPVQLHVLLGACARVLPLRGPTRLLPSLLHICNGEAGHN